jgi:hypothetical protein
MTTLSFAGAVLASLVFPPAGAVVAYDVGVITALLS